MNIKQWNQAQIEEANSPINRYFFWLKNKREPSDLDELLMFYIESGGAKNFAEKHKHEREKV
jgi:hypothetical protein